jgi:hypothetical protein
MKKILVVFILWAILNPVSAQIINQNTNPNNLTMPYHNPYDSALNPDFCDTLTYIFNSITDSFRTNRFTQRRYLNYNDSNMGKRISYSRLPGAQSDNIITGSPFAFYCPYRYGKDSIAMFRIFSGLVSNIKECLLTGPVDSLFANYSLANDNSRIIRYRYQVRSVKPGIDPKLTNVLVIVEFNPDKSGLKTDNFITYRVNVIIRP